MTEGVRRTGTMIDLAVFITVTGISIMFMWLFLQPATKRERIAIPTISITIGLLLVLIAPVNEQTAMWIVGAFSLPWVGIGAYHALLRHEMGERMGIDDERYKLHTTSIRPQGVPFAERDYNG